MRPGVVALVLASLTFACIGPLAAADPYTLAQKPRERDFWRNSYMPTPAQKPRSAEDIKYNPSYSEQMAARLGMVDGQARLFRVELDDPRKNGRTVEGGLGGKGVQLRLRW